MFTTLIVILFLILLTFIYAGFQGAPWVPTRKKDVERFLKLAEIKVGQKMYDLGCGDGRLVCAAAKVGANAQGLELSLLPFLLAYVRKLFSKDRHRIKIYFKNIWKTNLSDADIIYVWLMPEVMSKLKIKLEQELKKGTKVITYVWPIEGWQPIKTDFVEGSLNIYLYQIT